MQPKTVALIALAFTIFVWGVAPALVRGFALTTGAADALVIRMWTTAVFALPLFVIAGWRLQRSDASRMVLVGLCNFVYFVGSIFGYSLVPAGFGSMIIAVQPLLIALIAAGLGRDKLHLAAIIGLVISFAGTLYLFSGNSGGEIAWGNMVKGGLLLLLCDFGWAFYVIFSKPLLLKYGAIKITAWTLIVTALPSVAFISGSTLPALQGLDAGSWASLLFLSIVATVICVVTWNYATGFFSATSMGASLYLVPLLAVVAGWAWLGEKASLATLIGGLVILLGVAVAEFGKGFSKVKTLT